MSLSQSAPRRTRGDFNSDEIVVYDHGNPRRFSFANVRDMDIALKSGEDTPDVTVWHETGWEAHNE